MPSAHRSPAPAALLAASLVTAQLATFQDLVRDELGCDVDDVVIDDVSDAGATPELVAAQLRADGACEVEPPQTLDGPRPRRMWWPSRVTLDAQISSLLARDVISRDATHGRALLVRLTWSLGRTGR